MVTIHGFRLSVNVYANDVTRLKKAGGKVKFEFREKEKNKDPVFRELSSEDIAATNSVSWVWHIDASGGGTSNDNDISYRQRYKFPIPRDSDEAYVTDDTKAPADGFLFENGADDSELELWIRKADTDMYLGSYKKGEHKVIPEPVFRVTISSDSESASREITFKPDTSKTVDGDYVQSITYKGWAA